MDYANIYSFIHTHDLDPDALREALSDDFSRKLYRYTGAVTPVKWHQ